MACIGVAGFESQLQLVADADTGRQQWWLKWLGVLLT